MVSPNFTINATLHFVIMFILLLDVCGSQLNIHKYSGNIHVLAELEKREKTPYMKCLDFAQIIYEHTY